MSNDGDLRIRAAAARELHELRRRVLRDNSTDASVTDSRDDEPTARHFGGWLDQRLVVSASFYPTPSPVNGELPSFQLRYMATDFDVQGRGYGARLLAVAEEDLRRRGARQLWAKGRDTALGFYLATGWQLVDGSEHLSAETQLPHTVIHKLLLGA